VTAVISLYSNEPERLVTAAVTVSNSCQKYSDNKSAREFILYPENEVWRFSDFISCPTSWLTCLSENEIALHPQWHFRGFGTQDSIK